MCFFAVYVLCGDKTYSSCVSSIHLVSVERKHYLAIVTFSTTKKSIHSMTYSDVRSSSLYAHGCGYLLSNRAYVCNVRRGLIGARRLIAGWFAGLSMQNQAELSRKPEIE